MLITEKFVLEILEPFSPQVFFAGERTFHFHTLQFPDAETASWQEDVLYLYTLELAARLPDDVLSRICILCPGRSEDFRSLSRHRHMYLIGISPDSSLTAAANRLYTAFHRISQWQHQAEMLLASGHNYQQLLTLAAEIFGENPVIMVNASYNLLASSLPAAPSHPQIDTLLREGYYPKEVMDELARMGYQAKSRQYTTPVLLYPPNYMGCPFIIRSIYTDTGIFLGFITVYFIASAPSPSQFDIFSWLSARLRDCCLASAREEPAVPTPLEVLISDLLHHTREEEAYLADRARVLGLPADASYRLGVIYLDHFSASQAVYLCRRLRECLKFSFCKVLLYRQSVLLLLGGNAGSLQEMEDMDDSLSELERLLNICRGCAGFSVSGIPLMQMDMAYRQAKAAAVYGRRLLPGQQIYFYARMYIYEMLDLYGKEYSLKDLYVRKLSLLSDTGRKPYDDLTLLRVYLLSERNISATSRQMHMHRNSVIYRLNKIQELLALDLNDPDVRLRLMISFKTLELADGAVSAGPELPGNPADFLTFPE